MTLDPEASVTHLLDRYGPGSSARVGRDEAIAYVRGLALGHYENFSVLSRLVPPDVRDDFAAFYAFCRWADDLGDETGSDDAARARSLELLSWWRRLTHDCFASASDEGSDRDAVGHPVFVALRETAKKFGLGIEPFLDLIDAFEQDQRFSRYRTWGECVDYCRRSANPVGRVVLWMGGYPPPGAAGARADAAEMHAMSDATCTALQLTNFWQDVRRDLIERGRVYLPEQDVGFGAGELREWLGRGEDPAVRVRYIKAVRSLVDRTRELFTEGAGLVARLNGEEAGGGGGETMRGRRISRVVWLFGAGGRAVLERIESCGCATLWTRPRLGKAAKAILVARAALGLGLK